MLKNIYIWPMKNLYIDGEVLIFGKHLTTHYCATIFAPWEEMRINKEYLTETSKLHGISRDLKHF